MFICLAFTRRDLKNQQMGKKLATYQNIEKSLVFSTKKSDMSWITVSPIADNTSLVEHWIVERLKEYII